MSSPKTDEVRKLVNKRWGSWRYWKAVHTWLYIIIGATSSGVATFVAVNSKYQIVKPEHAWIWALIAAVLTFIISALGAQAEAKSFELGARMLEVALAKYDTDPDFGDKEIGVALAKAVETLNRKG